MNVRNFYKPIDNESGMVLLVSLLVILVLILVGTTSIMTTSTDLKISGNYKTGEKAFYVAEAGIEAARKNLRSDLATKNLTAILGSCANGGTLSDSSDIYNFYSNGAFITKNQPYIPEVSFADGRYQVYLTNDQAEGVTSTTDANLKVTATSFGFGPNGSMAIVQSVLKYFTLPDLPGAIVLPGPDVIFNAPNSNAYTVAGGNKSAVSLTSSDSEATVEKNIDPKRLDQYTCLNGTENGINCINNEAANFSDSYKTVSGITSLYNTIASVADSTLTGPVTVNDATLGTSSDPQIVVVEGDAVIGPKDGAGILVVTGTLTLKGNFKYSGLIMCIGQGKVLRDGAGNGDIYGSIFVANTNDAASNNQLGIPTFDTSGGGTSDIWYDPSEINPPSGRTFLKVSWKRF
jgi:hypothetical protein